jgi:predicted hotdog family 3-hydroxylacyl-ACP dehydratase
MSLDALDRRWIARHIPHQGGMCLLARVEYWDSGRVRCRAISHRDPNNPLRAHGRLGAACGIEYAAQAMAVHGALLAGAKAEAAPRPGMLASVRTVILHTDRLDDIDGELLVEAACFSGDGNNVIYDFSLRADGRILVEGRATVILDAQAGLPVQPKG